MKKERNKMWNYAFGNVETGVILFVRTFDHKNALRIMEEQLDGFDPDNYEYLDKVSDFVAEMWGYDTLTD
jgi:hypothetical protein